VSSLAFPPSLREMSVLTRLSSVASQELALALVPELPGHACSYHPVIIRLVWETFLTRLWWDSKSSSRLFISQKYSICHVDKGVGRLKGRLSHALWWCRFDDDGTEEATMLESAAGTIFS
jgi:hypothetical protein